MSKFIENMLKEEEKLTGFNPGEPDDDTFTVPESGYPHDLPYLNDIEADDANIADDVINDALNIAPKAKALPPDEVTSAEQIDIPDEGSVWDAFGYDEESKQDTPAIDSFDEPEYFEDTKAVPDIQEPIAGEKLAAESSFDDFNPEFDAEPELPAGAEPVSLEADTDLQNLIMKDLERGKKRKSTQKPKVSQEERDFKPVDDSDDAQLIDISKIDIDDNYNKIIGEQSSKSAKAQVNKPQVKEDKKKKRAFPWRLAAFSAVALFIMTIGILMFYIWKYQPEIANKLGLMTDETYTEKISTDSSNTQNSKSDKEKITEKNIEKTAEKDAEKESQASAEKETQENIDDITSLDKSKQDSVAAAIEAYKKEFEKDNSDKLKIAKTDYNINKPKSNLAKNSEAEPTKKSNIAKIKSDKTKSQKPTSKPKNSDLASGNTKIITNDNSASVTNTTLESSKEDKAIRTLNQLEEEGTFVVQIYSTPSKDDAQEWLNRLKNKNLSGYISEHKVRDVIWYRVRFGEFSSKDEARSAAMKYGFAQSWIDRIR